MKRRGDYAAVEDGEAEGDEGVAKVEAVRPRTRCNRERWSGRRGCQQWKQSLLVRESKHLTIALDWSFSSAQLCPVQTTPEKGLLLKLRNG